MLSPSLVAMEKPAYNLVIAATGSVDTARVPALIKAILACNTPEQKYEFKILALVVTKTAKYFFSTSDLPPGVPVKDDASEWDGWKPGDPILHIELVKDSDMMVIAPLTANTLAKLTLGLCNNLLTSIVRAWDMSKPLLFCPSMNIRMWDHAITAKQIDNLTGCKYEEVPPVNGTSVGGACDQQAMPEVSDVVKRIKNIADKKFSKVR